MSLNKNVLSREEILARLRKNKELNPSTPRRFKKRKIKTRGSKEKKILMRKDLANKLRIKMMTVISETR